MEFISGEKDSKKLKDLYYDLQYNRFIRYEQILDSAEYGKRWLSNERVAKVIKDAVHYRDGNKYKLIAYTIMPNHIHLIFIPIVKSKSTESINRKTTVERIARFAQDGEQTQELKYQSDSDESLYIVTNIMRDLKKFTAKEANKILNRKGNFWQHESYDHVIRDERELRKLVQYILNNPIKSGLTDDPYKYEWNYFNSEYII